METLTGIFTSSHDAFRATRRLESVLSRDDIVVLIPANRANAEVMLASTWVEHSGEAIDTIMVKATVPGVGPVIGRGNLGGILLRSMGGGVGQATVEGAIPHAALFVYEDALRRGRSVLTASGDESNLESVRELMEQEGAETVERQDDAWWVDQASAGEPRPTQEDPDADNSDSGGDEKFYRLGYEAALHAKYRCKEYDQIMAEMQSDLEELQQRHPGVDLEKAFVKGFEQGRAHVEAECQGTAPPESESD